jgi:four helix bundle protein
LCVNSESPYQKQATESPRDFIHKLRISLKELRETQRWLKIIQRVPLTKKPELLNDILEEEERSDIIIRRSTFNVRCWMFIF